MIDSFCIASFA